MNNTENPPKAKNESQPRKKKYYYRKRYYNKNKQKQTPEKTNFKKVSVLVPLYNEEESLRPLYIETKKSVNSINSDYEILFVDDGSTDKSLQVIRELCREDKKINYISFRKNYGKAAALQVGFKNVTGDAVITMDADLQDDPAEIPNLLKKLNEGFDLVSGWKKKRKDPFIKKHSSKFFNYITKLMTGIKIHDFNCGLKAYRREVVKNVTLYGELHRYIPVLADWKGFSVSEIAVKHSPRRYGKTKYGISRFFKGFVDLITVLFTTRYNRRPMHLFGLMGALSFFLGLIVSGYLTFEKLYFGKYISNRPLLFLGILLIIVGIQFFSIGLIGEIIVHQNKDDSEYLIKDKK
ncbi:MAG: glycosyltransferase family 2 protein [Ignavibacteria bacterium]|jgi:glycosyltransferase involved in cell wall biosynthesis